MVNVGKYTIHGWYGYRHRHRSYMSILYLLGAHLVLLFPRKCRKSNGCFFGLRVNIISQCETGLDYLEDHPS